VNILTISIMSVEM